MAAQARADLGPMTLHIVFCRCLSADWCALEASHPYRASVRMWNVMSLCLALMDMGRYLRCIVYLAACCNLARKVGAQVPAVVLRCPPRSRMCLTVWIVVLRCCQMWLVSQTLVVVCEAKV